METNMKDDYWQNFLKNLKENEFDNALKDYLEAIEYISSVTVEDIDKEETREEINNKLLNVEKFVKEYEKSHYEVSQIKGFKTNTKKNGEWAIRGRDYYYYIADQKMKASVYYVRYRNFIEKHMEEVEKAEEILDEKISEIKKLLNGKSIDINKDNVIDIIDDIDLNSSDPNWKLTIKDNQDIQKNRNICLECIEQIRSKEEPAYLKYMLFNNMMKEIRFVGGSYQYLWHWRKRKLTLFRSGPIDDSKRNYKENKNERIKEMFETCIGHMNGPSQILRSYSEQPLLDIYKYLILKKKESEIHIEIDLAEETDNQAMAKLDENTNTEMFHILKNADINCIYQNGKPMSFCEYVINSDNNKDDFSFCVEMFPQALDGERNAKGTVKYLRDIYFPEYFRTWGIEANLSKTKIADDKEVIGYGKHYQKQINLDEDVKEGSTEEIEDNSAILYSMTLNKKDVIYLLLKIGEKKYRNDRVIEEILKRIRVYYNKREFIDGYGKNTDCTVNCQIKLGSKKMFLERNKIFEILEMNIKVLKEFYEKLKSEDNERFPVDKAVGQFEKIIIDRAISLLKKRYEDILKSENKKVDFIISSIEDESYDFNLIGKYEEYLTDIEDCEVAALKSVIFKE